jgi:hypothetical protein
LNDEITLEINALCYDLPYVLSNDEWIPWKGQIGKVYPYSGQKRPFILELINHRLSKIEDMSTEAFLLESNLIREYRDETTDTALCITRSIIKKASICCEVITKSFFS